MSRKAQILVVDDEPAMRAGLQELLEQEGCTVDVVADGGSAMERMRQTVFDLVVTDLVMEGVDGMMLLEWTREHCPETLVIMITGYSTVPSAVEAMQKGAFHYLAKPFQLDEVRMIVRHALDSRLLQQENLALRRELEVYHPQEEIVGQSRGIRSVLDLVTRIAPTDSPVLIYGETGTGKELIARRIHEESARNKGAFITVNSASLPENLLESELFGHVKGAFTGAHSNREGLFQAADGGTLFLDEVGDVGLAAQARLLRALESGEIRRVGEDLARHVDVRIIAATNCDLQQAVKQKAFREDLYYRLNVVSLTVPPLRDRREDIPLLAEHFGHLSASSDRRPFTGFTREVLDYLKSYGWPGNVRELENAIRRAVILSGGRLITMADLPPSLLPGGHEKEPDAPSPQRSLEEVERRHILDVLRSTGGNKTRAAEILGISRPTLRSKLGKYGVQADED